MKSRRSVPVYRIFAALFIALALLGSLGKQTQGQVSGWIAPRALSSTDFFSWFPDIVADPYGNLHVVWASGVVGFDSVYYTTSSDGFSWRTPNDIFANPWVGTNSGATRPTLLVDHNSNLNITFIDPNQAFYSRVPLWDASYALSWLPRETMSSLDQTAYFSRMAIDSQNRLHYVYTQNMPSAACSNCYHVFYRQSTDDGNTWSEPVDLMDTQIGAVKPQILVDRSDNIYLVWETGQGGGLGQLSGPTTVTFAASYDAGKTWTIPTDFPVTADESAKNITIGIDRNNDLVVAWWSLPEDLIMYQTSSNKGRTWSDPTPIPLVWGAAEVYKSNLDDYSMASDSAGNLHLVAVGRVEKTQTDLNIVDLVWDGTEWAAPDIIATYKGDVPEWPRIAINKGNQLNVVWFVRDEAHIWESDKGRYRVWFSQGYASAPSRQAEPVPSLTPTAQATPTLEPTATTPPVEGDAVVTAEPTLNPADQIPPVNVPLSETDYIPLLAKALLPSILFVVGIFVVTFVRRR